MKRILLVLAAVVVLAVAGFAAWVASRQDLRFTAPEPEIVASRDAAVLARGRYIVRDVAPCAACHGSPIKRAAFAAGEDVPLSGGREWKIPPGSIFARNITPDPSTGIGNLSDGQIARALRHGVGHDGRALLPFMEMQGLSDEDLTAVVSYLRAEAPAVSPVPDHRFNLLGKVVRATVLANPVGPKEPPPVRSPRGVNVENGRYLAASVANCQGCHTPRNLNTGALTGPEFSGTDTFTDDDDPNRIWAPPNLTPDPKTGVIAQLTEDAFLARFRAGRTIPGSPMPWQALGRMTDDDLRAIFRFLKSLPPVERDTGPPVRSKG